MKWCVNVPVIRQIHPKITNMFAEVLPLDYYKYGKYPGWRIPPSYSECFYETWRVEAESQEDAIEKINGTVIHEFLSRDGKRIERKVTGETIG